ncbi:MAG: RsmE family RNA methyltransferase [Gemmatimonadaceae bacterium]|jgi:16S rRNA (uracil1498-N3)-methyltransferase|nr:RsmE family RNA methyltransferase [Gemmatimonadaceae bacterium]
MVERSARRGIATVVAPEPLVAGTSITLGEEIAHHLRVRRIEVGDRVGLRDGAGTVAEGTLVRLAKGAAVVDCDQVQQLAPPAPVHLLVPVADRDRMLWLAEKVTELGATSWRPVLWRRSRSVASKGEGKTFGARVRARMESALGQSGGAWLPATYPEAPVDRAISALPADGARLVLERGHATLAAVPLAAPVILAIGPEGGFDADELEQLRAAHFVAVGIGPSILRFETAGVAALGIVTARLHTDTDLSAHALPSAHNG